MRDLTGRTMPFCRRQLLGAVAAGVITSAPLTDATAQPNASPDMGQFSVADAILLVIEDTFEVVEEAALPAMNKWYATLVAVRATLSQIRDQAHEFERQVASTPLAALARTITERIDAAIVSGTSESGSKIIDHLDYCASTIAATIQPAAGPLPDRDVKLNRDIVRTLNKLFVMIDSSQEQSKVESDAYRNYRNERDRLDNLGRELRTALSLLVGPSGPLTVRDFGSPNAKQLATSIREIVPSVEKISGAEANLLPESIGAVVITQIKGLGTILDGDAPRHSSRIGPMSQLAAIHPGGALAISRRLEMLAGGIAGLLSSDYPDYTFGRALRVLWLIGPIIFWYSEPKDRRVRIQAVIPRRFTTTPIGRVDAKLNEFLDGLANL